jgi:hypothetical protein
MVSFTPKLLYLQGKSSSHPLDRRLGLSKSQSGQRGEDKNILPLLGIKP